MIIIAFIAYFFWGILGLLFWIPLLVRVIAGFCGSLVYNMVTNNPTNIQNAKQSLELAIGFYSKGFESIHSTIYGTKQVETGLIHEEFHYISFIFQILWTILFWASIILPFTKIDLLSFRKEYVFKESFNNNAHNWLLRETENDKISINNGRLFINCKENPRDTSYGFTSSFCSYPISDYPTKYTIEANGEFIKGNINKDFGLILNDTVNNIQIGFNVYKDKFADVILFKNKSSKILCDNIAFNSNSNFYEILICIKNNDFTYNVNGAEIFKGNFDEFILNQIRPYASRNQLVAFDEINIIKN